MLVPDLLLQLVKVVRQGRHLHFQALPLTDAQDQLLHLAALLEAVAWQAFPVVEDRLWECLAAGRLAQCGDEAKRFRHRQVSLDLDQWRALTRILLEDAASPKRHAAVDTTKDILRGRDVHQEDWLLQCRRTGQLGGKAAAPRGRHDLSCPTVNLVGVEEKRTPRRLSSHRGPSFVTHWKAFTT